MNNIFYIGSFINPYLSFIYTRFYDNKININIIDLIYYYLNDEKKFK